MRRVQSPCLCVCLGSTDQWTVMKLAADSSFQTWRNCFYLLMLTIIIIIIMAHQSSTGRSFERVKLISVCPFLFWFDCSLQVAPTCSKSRLFANERRNLRLLRQRSRVSFLIWGKSEQTTRASEERSLLKNTTTLTKCKQNKCRQSTLFIGFHILNYLFW